MLLRDSKSASLLAYPAIVAVTLFLLRNRQITDGSSSGSGVTIAGAELLMRVSALFHAAVTVGAQGFALLLRVATAPAILAFTTLESEARIAVGGFQGAGAMLQHASLYLLHAL